MSLATKVPKPHSSSLNKALKTMGLVLVAVLYVISARGTGFSIVEIWKGLPAFFNLLGEMTSPNWSIITRLQGPFIETMQIAIVGTTIGGVLSIPVILLSSNNVNTNAWLYFVSKTIMNLIRTIPELLYAAVLVAAVGLGPFAGVLALSVFSLAIIAKLTSESVEAIDNGPLEALSACGANKLENILYAVVPQVLPIYVSYFLYVLEINIRVSTVLGVVGAGGIGQLLMTQLNLFRYANAASIIVATFAFVVAIDVLSTKLRARLI